MEREVICTGHSGKGIYCSSCGKWRGSADFFCKIPDIPCECGERSLEIVSPYQYLYVTQTT